MDLIDIILGGLLGWFLVNLKILPKLKKRKLSKEVRTKKV